MPVQNKVHMEDKIILMHIVTVPQSLCFLNGQAHYMQIHGLEVHAVSSPGKKLNEFGKSEHIKTHSVKMIRGINPFADLIAIWKLYCLIKELSPTIVHAHTPKAGLLGMVASWLAKTPIRIYHIHGLVFLTATGIKRRLLRTTERIACKLATEILSVSKSITEVVINDGICPNSKIKVLGHGSINGIDALEIFNPNKINSQTIRNKLRIEYNIPLNAIIIGFVGRIVKDKGLVELICAWKRLEKKYSNIHLLVVGPFENQNPIPKNIRLLMESDTKIHLTGMVDNVAPYYTTMDIFVLPSYREGFGTVVIEASAMELPVIATRIPGCLDSVVDNVTGILVSPFDDIELERIIELYISNPELRVKHGQAGRKRVLEEFSQDTIWDKMHNEYALLLSQRGIDLC